MCHSLSDNQNRVTQFSSPYPTLWKSIFIITDLHKDLEGMRNTLVGGFSSEVSLKSSVCIWESEAIVWSRRQATAPQGLSQPQGSSLLSPPVICAPTPANAYTHSYSLNRRLAVKQLSRHASCIRMVEVSGVVSPLHHCHPSRKSSPTLILQ